MIKPLIYITCALTLLPMVTSCSDEPTFKADPARYITFAAPTIDINATVAGFGSRAAVSRADLNAPIEKFKVWGFCQAQDATGKPSTSSIGQFWNEKANFFTQGADVENLKGNIVTVSGANTSYNGGELTPWADYDDPQYSFIAVSVTETPDIKLDDLTTEMANASMSSSDSHGPRLTVTLPINDNNIDQTRDYNSQPDVMVAWKFDQGPADSPIGLKFMHIMTGIRFKFQNLTDKGLRITEVTYAGNFYKQAVFNFNTNKPMMSVNIAQTYSCTFNLFSGAHEIGSNQAEYMGGDNPVTLLLLPNPDGTTNDDGKYTLGTDKIITISYQRQDENGQWSEVKPFPLSNLTLSYIPKPNTLHTATFNFVGDGFVTMFHADNQENWEKDSDININIH